MCNQAPGKENKSWKLVPCCHNALVIVMSVVKPTCSAPTLVKPLPNLQQTATLHCTAHIVHNKAVPSALQWRHQQSHPVRRPSCTVLPAVHHCWLPPAVSGLSGDHQAGTFCAWLLAGHRPTVNLVATTLPSHLLLAALAAATGQATPRAGLLAGCSLAVLLGLLRPALGLLLAALHLGVGQALEQQLHLGAVVNGVKGVLAQPASR